MNVLKIKSDFGLIKALWNDYLSISQDTDMVRYLIAMDKDAAIKLAEWIFNNVRMENKIEEI